MKPVWDVLVYFVLPAWMAAGFCDYLCHRISGIEVASGARESALHWLMLGEAAIPIFMALFLQIDALVLALMLIFLVAHEVTAHLDIRLAVRTRSVTPFEQQTHSFLEILPLMAVALVCVLHWPQFLALFGTGAEHADFRIMTKPPPRLLEIGPFGVALVAMLLVPYADEFARGLKASRRNSSGSTWNI